MAGHDTASYFNELYEATRKNVLVRITAKCGSTEDIKDIFQDTYMDLYRVILQRGTDYIREPGPFVMRLAQRRIYAHYSLSEKVGHIVPFLRDDETDAEPDMPDDAPPLEDSAIERETVRNISEFIKTKDDASRKIFYLYYYMEQTISDIASEMSLNESTVKSKLYRLRAEIRALYGKEIACND